MKPFFHFNVYQTKRNLLILNTMNDQIKDSLLNNETEEIVDELLEKFIRLTKTTEK